MSIPIAIPLITHIPLFASSDANILAYFLPYSEQFLDPTMATIFCSFNNPCFLPPDILFADARGDAPVKYLIKKSALL